MTRAAPDPRYEEACCSMELSEWGLSSGLGTEVCESSALLAQHRCAGCVSCRFPCQPRSIHVRSSAPWPVPSHPASTAGPIASGRRALASYGPRQEAAPRQHARPLLRHWQRGRARENLDAGGGWRCKVGLVFPALVGHKSWLIGMNQPKKKLRLFFPFLFFSGSE